MIKKTKIYRYDKLLKLFGGFSDKDNCLLFLYTKPKNFKKNLDEAEQMVAKQQSKKRKYGSLIFFLINLIIIAIILGVQIANQGDMSISTLLNSTFNPNIFLLIIIIWFVIQLFEMVKTTILVKQSTGKYRPFLSYKTNAIGKYYDCITPMSTGGQPFQIFYMNKRGLNASSAISVPMGRYVIGQLCISTLWTVILIVGLSMDLGPNFNYIKPLCIIGWVLNFCLMALVMILSINQRVGKKLVYWAFKLLQKLKIVKNFEKNYNAVVKTVSDFQSTIKNFTKNFGTFIFMIVFTLISQIMYYGLAFLIYCCLIGHLDFSMFWQIVILCCLIEIAASFIPLPGGSGVNELSFTALFSFIMPNGVMLTWALIFWRLFSYYIYLLQGILVMAYDNLWGNQKYKWLKKKWELEAESITFTQDKLHEFNLEKMKNKKNIV